MIKPIRISLDYEEADFVRRALAEAWFRSPQDSNEEMVLNGVLLDLREKVREARAADEEIERLFGPKEVE